MVLDNRSHLGACTIEDRAVLVVHAIIKREMSTFVLDITPYKELSMKRKLLVFSAIMLSLTANLYAQENRAMTHSMYDKLTINPGSTGIEEGIC